MANPTASRLTPLPRLTQIAFHVSEQSAPIVARALGLEALPAANRFVAADGCNVLWISPTEFLAIGEAKATLEAVIRGAMPSGQGAVVDVSANRIGFMLAGPDARDVLAGCCALDFHPRVFRTGCSAGTLIAKAQALIAQIDEGPSYLILVRPSFASYVKAWLLP
ncbi:MAG: sarcosine oxidase subunit gamma [Gemmatimonadetes bacterium]|nr:sarcosine oxidase subunit gamma [Gemmatimonadota bacterium]